MSRVLVLTQLLGDRRRSFLGWSLALVLLVGLTVAVYPSVRQSAGGLDAYAESLPEGVAELLGAAQGLTSPAGYLDSQVFATTLPVLLVVFAVGLGTRVLAGSEQEGTLELLLANPVPRARVAAERFAGLVLLLTGLTLVSTAVVVVTAPALGLDEGLAPGGLAAAGVGNLLLALVFGTLAFAAGAASGSRPAALAAGAGAAAGTFVLEALAVLVDGLASLRWLSPWSWYREAAPLTHGFSVPLVGLPLLVVAVAYAVGVAALVRRDIR